MLTHRLQSAYMDETATKPIRIRPSTWQRLTKARLHPRETHDDVIRRLLAKKNGKRGS